MYRLPSLIRSGRLALSSRTLVPRLGASFSTSQKQNAKELKFGADARSSMLLGVEVLADAVAVTLGPKVLTTVFLQITYSLN